ncbi:MAG: hypothetical protein AMJ43_07830 [Coxiella sp. DG_40]|nr:MAG: hypothetical protein AMJ43_07830 [Coxiella sp. DG_40]
MYSSVKRGRIKEVERLIRKGVDIHSDYDLALVLSASFNHINILKLLLENGADVRTQDHLPLKLALEDGNFKLVELLVKHYV